jgi:hypothetical protein
MEPLCRRAAPFPCTGCSFRSAGALLATPAGILGVGELGSKWLFSPFQHCKERSITCLVLRLAGRELGAWAPCC